MIIKLSSFGYLVSLVASLALAQAMPTYIIQGGLGGSGGNPARIEHKQKSSFLRKLGVGEGGENEVPQNEDTPNEQGRNLAATCEGDKKCYKVETKTTDVKNGCTAHPIDWYQVSCESQSMTYKDWEGCGGGGRYICQKEEDFCSECYSDPRAEKEPCFSDYGCGPGLYCDSTQKCKTCSPGSYASASGSTDCVDCPRGQYQDKPGMATCSVCSAGTFSGDGADSCTSCSVGYYCPENSPAFLCQEYKEYCPRGGMAQPDTSCPSTKFGSKCEQGVSCLTNRGSCDKDDCWNFYGDGTCTECNDANKAGSICEHNVCRKSKLADSILAAAYPATPATFDFSLYLAEDLDVLQESQTDGDFGIFVLYRPVSSDIKEHRLVINDLDVGTASAAVSNCHDDQRPDIAKMPMYAINEASVGTSMAVCIRGIWKDSTLSLTGGSWDSPTRGNDRPTPQACINYIIQFQTHLTFSIRDLYNTIGIEKVAIRYTVAGVEFTDTTDTNGKISRNVLIPNLQFDTGSVELIIEEVSHPSTADTANFVHCLSKPLPGSPCDESQQKNLAVLEPIFVEHLNREPQEILIVDKTAERIAGRVVFASPDPNSQEVCGFPEARIYAIDARQSEGKDVVLFNVTTDETGEFEFAVSRQTLLRIEIKYGNHIFVDNKPTGLFSQEGRLISDSIEDLEFKDITTSDIIVTSAVTECMFGIGNYDLKLSVPSCNQLGVYRVPSNGRETFAVTVPAHSYEFLLDGFDGFEGVDGGSILSRFDYMFPERTLNMTESPASVRFIYHPDPTVTLEVGEGLQPPETFASTICAKDYEGEPPFHFALEGNSYAALRFEFRQVYMNEGSQYFCDILPENSKLLIESDLGQPNDPCSSLSGGCEVDAEIEEYQGFNLTLAKENVFTGLPTHFGEDKAGKTIEDYVGSKKITYTVFNPSFFNSPGGKAGEGVSKILLLGHKPLTGDSLVSFFSEGQDHIPILYLNSLPAGVGGFLSNRQSVSLDLAVTAVTKQFASTDIRVGGGGYVGIKNKGDAFLCVPFVGCAVKISAGENTFQAGLSEFNSDTTSYVDEVHSTVTSKGLQLSTPLGAYGKDGDMVLLVGTVANFITAVSVSFSASECTIEEHDSTVWGSDMESLLFYSRTDCEIEFDKLEKTIQDNLVVVNDTDTSVEDKNKAQQMIDASVNSKKKWNALFQHWENDRLQAKNRKVDLSELGGIDNDATDNLNTFTFGSSSITLTKTSSDSSSSVLDYESTGTVTSNTESYAFELLFGAGFIVGPVGGGNFEYTSTTKSLSSTTKDTSNSRQVSASFNELDSGDRMCVEVYESPHSGTFIFEVCGGETRCPRVPGTDAREKFTLNMIESPTGMLQQDSGRIVMEIDTLDMPNSLDDLDVVLELDASTALFPVRFDIGSASLNQPLEFTVAARKKTAVYIAFERLDLNLKSVQIIGSVRSKCDSSITQRFSFNVEWASQCPPVHWGGALVAMDGYFGITSKQPDVGFTAVNPTGTRWKDYKDVDMRVSLWFRQSDSLTDLWKEVPDGTLRSLRARASTSSTFVAKEDSFGSATLWLSGDNNALFRSGARYEFELRSECFAELDSMVQKVGETRSGPRLGIVDLYGPKIISWAVTQSVNVPTLGFPVCKLLFNEAIDCSHPSLRATIRADKNSTSLVTAQSKVYCTGRSQQLNVVLELALQDDVEFWSQADIEVEISGIRDVHGNMHGQDGSFSGRRLEAKQPVRMNFTVPVIPDLDGSEKPWVVPSNESINAMVEEERQRMLPLGIALPTAHISSDVPLPKPSTDGKNVAVAIMGGANSCIAAVAALVLAFVW